LTSPVGLDQLAVLDHLNVLWHAERVSTTLAVVERRRDGKLHPAGGYHAPGEVEQAAGIIHTLRCGQGLPFRTIQARLADRGLRFSLGSVYHYWRAYSCDRCAS
jgi:hypothetical protein